ncbi:sensor histidine kinase [Bacillus niameyensis]|uniref:sensor histidine kinase n=1 Tax=Bacillus niameyensis TaxID=1522308 RepID=UPI00078116C6|nr:histidine kinase [Bacillus niameyensis]
MKSWFVRILAFAILWGCMWVGNDVGEKELSVQLIVCAAAFTLYFFLPIVKRPVLFFVILQSLLSVLVLVHTPMIWVWLFLLFITVEAVFHLTALELKAFIIYSIALLIIASALLSEWVLPLYIFAIILFFIEIRLNRYVMERQEQRDVYEQLLGEYRQLKRMNLENEQVARLEERTRIARDIHDSVGHKLTALLMQLEMFSMQNQSGEYAELKQLAKESLEETRQAVKTLKQEEVAGITSVVQLIRKLESENHLLIRFTMKQGVLLTKLSNAQSIVLYRSIQEALTNAMKHGSSREVELTLGRTAIGEIEWVISNVIHEPKPFELGFGLTAMRERIEEQAGQLRIYQTDKEFIIEGSMPVKENVG